MGIRQFLTKGIVPTRSARDTACHPSLRVACRVTLDGFRRREDAHFGARNDQLRQ